MKHHVRDTCRMDHSGHLVFTVAQMRRMKLPKGGPVTMAVTEDGVLTISAVKPESMKKMPKND